MTLAALARDDGVPAAPSAPHDHDTPILDTDLPAPTDGDDTPAWRVVSQAEGLLQVGRAAEALALLDTLAADGLHEAVARRLRAWARYASGDWAALEAATREPIESGGEMRLLHAAALVHLGHREPAVRALRELWWSSPESDWALGALYLLADETLAEVTSYRRPERTLIRARLAAPAAKIALDGRTGDDALLESLRRAAPRTGTLATELDYAVGARLLASEHFGGAIGKLEAARLTASQRPLRRAIELRLALAKRARGDYRGAQRNFANVAAAEGDPIAQEARSLSAQMAIEHRQFETAKAILEADLVANPLSAAREQALWGLGWVAFRTGAFREARRFFVTLMREQPYGARAPGAVYWAARSADELGDHHGAHSEMLALCGRFARDAYCWQAEHWISTRARDTAEVTAALPREGTPAHLARARSLARAGMRRRAGRELTALAVDLDALGPETLTAALDLARELSLDTLMPRLHARAIERYGVALPPGNGDPQAIPTAFAPLIDAAARTSRVDGTLLAAIIAVTSQFDPHSSSDTGTLGLMHLSPQTARELWREEHRRAALGRREMLDPANNVRLGARYLGRTVRAFGGRLAYALAAHDAGPGAVTRWREARGDLPDEIFIEEIPYPKTKRYVLEVLTRLQSLRVARRASTPALARLEHRAE